MDPVVHFEMPYDDRDRMAGFYSKAFGWKPQMLGEEMGNYVVVQTAEMDENNMLKEPGRINGGLYKRSKPDQGPSLVIAVKDINDAMEKVKNAGGTVLGGSKGTEEPDNIPGIGLYVAIADTEGNKIGMLQPMGM